MKKQVVMNYRKAVYIPKPAKNEADRVELKYVAALNQNLASLGFTLSAEAIEALSLCNKEDVVNFYIETSNLVLKLVGDIKVAPIWPNFPEDVKEASKLELYLVNIIYYLTKGEWAPDFQKDKAHPALIDFSALHVLNKAADDEYENIILQLILQNMPLSQGDREVLMKALFYKPVRETISKMLGEQKIPQKETLAMVASFYIGNGELPSSLEKQFVNAKDVMRVMAVRSGYDSSLASKVKFCSFPRKERAVYMKLLARQNSLLEDMAADREAWKRVGEKLHPGEFSKKYPAVYDAFAKVRANQHIETFNSVYERLLFEKKYAEAAEHLSARPGFLARNLDMLIRKAEAADKHGPSVDKILTAFSRVASQVDIRILLSLANHFANRDNEAQVITGRKGGASSHTGERELEGISAFNCMKIAVVLKGAFEAHYASRESVGSVYVAEEVANYKMPTTLRHANRALLTAVSGSHFPLEGEAEVLRGFVFWQTDDEEDRFDGADIDLSLVAMNENFEVLESVGYFNPSNKEYGFYHSGDVRFSGEEGGCEYLDASSKLCKKHDVAYIAYTVNCFSHHKFSDMNQCFVGYMGRDGLTGEIFEPKTVKNRFELLNDANESVAFIVDLKNNRVYNADISIGSKIYSNAANQSTRVADICKAVVEDNSMSITALVAHAINGGYMTACDNPEEADIVLTSEDVKLKEGAKKIHPGDINSIVELLA